MAAAADGTHPIGMHSCLFCLRFSASTFTYGREKKSVTLLHVKEMFLSLTIIEKSCTGCQLIYYCIIRLCYRQRVLASNFFRICV